MQENTASVYDRTRERQRKMREKRKRSRRIWRNCVSALACVVVFCVTYALILPAITLEKDTFCGIPAHTHDSTCYVGSTFVCDPAGEEGLPVLHTHDALCYDGETLICQLPELAGHVHSDSCYETVVFPAHTHDESCTALTQGALKCQLEEQAGHSHTDTCLVPTDTLVCTEEVQEGHAHGDSCYSTESQLTCTLEEGQGHTHEDTCYSVESALNCDQDHEHTDDCYTESKTLLCGVPEAPAHAHADSCYTEAKTLTCELPEAAGHSHTAACYEQVIGCGQEETEGHTHGEECYEQVSTLTCGLEERTEEETRKALTCTQPQIAPHTHDGSCSDESGALTCTIQNAVVHQHTEECIQPSQAEEDLTCGQQAHEHTLICYSDPTADLETAQDWEKTFADAELTGNWRQDVLIIAKTQLGYEESTKNYTVEGENTKGYTRYGDWYGIPYGDWCAMFASFCLDYAGVEGMPLDANCPNWINTLNNKNLYHVSGGYAPQGGDLIFFDWNADGSSDHVGIVEAFTPAEGDAPATVRTIEGNAGNCVKYNQYDMDDATIMGYGSLPAQLTEEEQAQVDYVVALIDAMPSADEIDAKVAEFAETGDEDGETAYLEQVYGQVAEAYYYYSQLGETLQAYVTNADKLLELEYIWSVTPYLNVITSAQPTVVGKTGTDPAVSTSEFVKLNIFDYYGAKSASGAGKTNINALWASNKKYPGFQWNGGAYMTQYVFRRWRVDNIDFGNSIITDYAYGGTSSGIEDGVSQNYQKVGDQGGTINQVIGSTNQPIGYSSGATYDALQHTLKNGYPALSDGTSLSYLFSESNYASKENSANIDGLFRQNQVTGEYWFDSRDNHAQYANNKFTLYNQIITPNFILYPFGNFLPFNDITNADKATQVSAIDYVVQSGNGGVSAGYMQTIINRLLEGTEDATENQLIDMLARYRDSLSKNTSDADNRYNWTVEDALVYYFSNSSEFGSAYNYNTLFASDEMQRLLDKLYNIDYDVPKNFLFGMDMEMTFMQPKNGMTGNDTNKDGSPDYPMEFYFAGDDDVWVYIDGILFLDLTGIHRHVGGDIDFVNGKVNYYMMDSYIDGAVESTPYETMTFADILTEIGGIAKSDLGNYLKKDANGNYTTFKDYTSHTFKFYYMERGTGSSVCRINFNFPMLRQNSISVAKDVSANTAIKGNPDYLFQVLKANSDGSKTQNLFIGANTAYTIYDVESNTQLGTGTTDANGVFTLKAGQRAEFTGIKENAGKYYVRELLEGTVLEQYGNVTVSGESTTTSNNVTVGSDTFTGMDSPVKDISDGATLFRFTNDVDEEKLGTLSVSKRLTEYPRARVTKTYDIEVTLDGVPIPVGMEYTVGAETRKVTTEGIITIAADETAVISNILAGTEFKVAETSGSAEGYVVTYTTENGYTVEQVTGGVKGVIIASANVQLIVTNSEKGTSVSIPGTKSMHAYDGVERTYTFRLNEVTDKTGTALKEGGIANLTATATVSGTPEDFGFTLTYVQVDIGTLPATFYYKITEDKQEGILTNTQSFVAEVKVEKDGADGIKATLVKIHGSENNSADFVNTITGDLKLEKFVDGGTEAQTSDSFNFTIKLDPGDSGVALKDKYPVTITQANGDPVDGDWPVTDGVMHVTDFHHSESFVIHDLPIGTTWTIEETLADGYKVKTTVTVGETTTDGTGTETNGTIVAGDTTVLYTNQQLYELPETGGTGTHVYTMAGLMLMLISTAYLLYRYRKRRREVS